MSDKKKPNHIILTSHPENSGTTNYPIDWGNRNYKKRGPIVADIKAKENRNAIGTYSGSYMIYKALSIATGQLDPDYTPDFSNTRPIVDIGPFDSWFDKEKIVSLDPLGSFNSSDFEVDENLPPIRPTIAITKARIHILELNMLIDKGVLKPDGKILREDGSCEISKAAIEPVWYLPGIAHRFKIKESELRRCLFEHTGGMFPELITRGDLKIFLPPIGGNTIYIFGDPKLLSKKDTKITCRVHDECNGSDVFGSDICTCRPYLIYGIERAISSAQNNGIGIVIYNRKEGRALGEVTKFLVYNARKRQDGGDSALKYFERTECVAGVQDVRFQELMPDTLQWLGIKELAEFVSMSNMKYDAIVGSGIKIKKRTSIPDDMIPNDAKVEMEAKLASGYFQKDTSKTKNKVDLQKIKGRDY